ncbi:Fic family protein [Methanomassiliicoccales archaeon LGM-RCC1]|nr:Fic family protein [Methanomassiliicoccales archaeon LGM-RCC1]
MHVFNYDFLKSSKVDADLLNRIGNIERIRDTAEHHDQQTYVLQALENRAVIMSVIDSNEIEGIRTSEERAVGLISERTVPKGHDEQEIAGYRDALRYIHRSHDRIKLDKESILGLYGILMSYKEMSEPGFKSRDNVIVDRDPDGSVSAVYETVPFQDTEYCIDQMLSAFWEARNDLDINKLLLIPCFIMDFLRIHPFLDGNGRMSRLLTVLLLYQEGYDVCRYVSIESKINASKSDYYRALEYGYPGWFDGGSDYTPFISYFISQLFLCYRDLNLSFGTEIGRSKKTDALESFLSICPVHVSKQDILSMFPDISETSVERTLRDLCDRGVIRKEGSTRSARYIAARR